LAIGIKKLNWIERIASVVIGLFLIYPEGFSDLIGLAGFIAMVVYQFVLKKGSGVGEKEAKEANM